MIEIMQFNKYIVLIVYLNDFGINISDFCFFRKPKSLVYFSFVMQELKGINNESPSLWVREWRRRPPNADVQNYDMQQILTEPQLFRSEFVTARFETGTYIF